MSTISTHVLDTSLGKPAQGVQVELESGGAIVGSGVTDADGRVKDLSAGAALGTGDYRLRFAVEAYFARDGRAAFYPTITIEFRIEATQHYHVPLLLSPFGYSTYRGS